MSTSQLFQNVIALSFVFYTYAQAAFSKEKGHSSSSVWPVILETLNGNATGSQIVYRVGTPIDVDLMKLYKSETKAVSELWKKESETQKDPKSKEAKRQENHFFHQQISKLNDDTFQKLEKIKGEAKDSKVDAMRLGAEILKEIRDNPVANLEATQSYDPSGQLGFCFGRALYVHYLLLKKGVSPSEIAKIFLAGQLRVAHRLWNFHVAVMLRDPKLGFVVIDPLFKDPMSLDDWKKETSAFDIKGQYSRARFYVTDPRKFLPSFGPYHRDQLESNHLKAYFNDLLKTLPR